MKKYLKSAIIYIILFAIVIIAVTQLFGRTSKEAVTYNEVLSYFADQRVKEFQVSSSNVLTMIVRDKTDPSKTTKVEYKLAYLDIFYEDLHETIKEQVASGVIEKAEYEPYSRPWYITFLPAIIIVALIALAFFLYFRASQNGSIGGGPASRINNFGKAHIKPTDEKKKVTFADVAGADEEKAELVELVDFLKDPAKYTKLGAKIPHGVLLMGPPGTGKTLLAKAVAGEAGVPFLSISGSDFVEMYVGVGASRVRNLFDTARKSPAAIIFIDEIDAVGRHRGAGLGGGHDEREQTLNQLLVEMDGFGSHEGIIVIAATNRPDILDPALLRPGRFDRQITVNPPDIDGRLAILKVHAKNKPFEPAVDFAAVAKMTVGFTGADLANLLNEASLLAARQNKALISMEDIQEAYIKVVAGPKKKSWKIKKEDLRKTAYHEAGHAILAHVLPTQDPVQQISIIPSGSALGYTLNPPKEDRYSVFREELKEKICMLLGGRAAEQLVCQDISGGAANDIERATKTAKRMVMQFGMSEKLGPVAYGGDETEVFLGRDFSAGKDHSEQTASLIDEEVQKIISDAYARALSILGEHRDKLDRVANYLLAHEMMDGEQFEALMDRDASDEELEEILEQRKRASQEANETRAREVKEKEDAEAKMAENQSEGLDFGGNSQEDAQNEEKDSDSAEESDQDNPKA